MAADIQGVCFKVLRTNEHGRVEGMNRFVLPEGTLSAHTSPHNHSAFFLHLNTLHRPNPLFTWKLIVSVVVLGERRVRERWRVELTSQLPFSADIPFPHLHGRHLLDIGLSILFEYKEELPLPTFLFPLVPSDRQLCLHHGYQLLYFNPAILNLAPSRDLNRLIWGEYVCESVEEVEDLIETIQHIYPFRKHLKHSHILKQSFMARRLGLETLVGRCEQVLLRSNMPTDQKLLIAYRAGLEGSFHRLSHDDVRGVREIIQEEALLFEVQEDTNNFLMKLATGLEVPCQNHGLVKKPRQFLRTKDTNLVLWCSGRRLYVVGEILAVASSKLYRKIQDANLTGRRVERIAALNVWGVEWWEMEVVLRFLYPERVPVPPLLLFRISHIAHQLHIYVLLKHCEDALIPEADHWTAEEIGRYLDWAEKLGLDNLLRKLAQRVGVLDMFPSFQYSPHYKTLPRSLQDSLRADSLLWGDLTQLPFVLGVERRDVPGEVPDNEHPEWATMLCAQSQIGALHEQATLDGIDTNVFGI